MPLACCYPHERPFTAIHDDVFVRTCYVKGDRALLVVSFDLLFHDDPLNQKIAAYANEKYGLPHEAVLVNYAHNHTAPAVKGYCESLASDEYEALLFNRTLACIDRAMTNVIEGNLEYVRVPCDQAMSRRRITNGVCGGIEPSEKNVRETTLDILKLTDKAGKIRGLIVSYAAHPVHYPGGSVVSGEYPARLCALLECEYYGAYAVFLQGAAGSSRPRSTVDGTSFKSKCDYEDVDTMAAALFNTVKSAINQGGFNPVELRIKGVAGKIKLPIDVLPKEYFENKAKTDLGYVNNEMLAFIIGNYETLGDTVELNAGMLRLSDNLYICHICGEICYEIKALLLKALPDVNIIFVGYTGYSPYIPTNRMLTEGGYETDCFIEFGKPGRFKSGIDDRITGAFISMYGDLVDGEKADETGQTGLT